ncbi:bifunctional methylenetetrahydrofolate dehydrogenase/methenyltetrahydrofolate cyclohydrolase FolD [Nanoarchaeota archaeon]
MILDGKKLAGKIEDELKKKIQALDEVPCLAVILIGEDPASKAYVGQKMKSCQRLGMTSKSFEMEDEITTEELCDLIKGLNQDEGVHGILVQLPLPNHIDKGKVLDTISPLKDVDGFQPMNVGMMMVGHPALEPCTPRGVMRLLDEYKIDLAGKDAVVVGKGNITGKPLAMMLMNRDATVTVCHILTKDLKSYTQKADIIISCAGSPNLIKDDMVKEGAVVVDVGYSRVDDPKKDKGYSIVGDVEFEKIKEKASFITPVPGGVGPMTVAILMENTYLAYNLQNEKS